MFSAADAFKSESPEAMVCYSFLPPVGDRVRALARRDQYPGQSDRGQGQSRWVRL